MGVLFSTTCTVGTPCITPCISNTDGFDTRNYMTTKRQQSVIIEQLRESQKLRKRQTHKKKKRINLKIVPVTPHSERLTHGVSQGPPGLQGGQASPGSMLDEFLKKDVLKKNKNSKNKGIVHKRSTGSSVYEDDSANIDYYDNGDKKNKNDKNDKNDKNEKLNKGDRRSTVIMNRPPPDAELSGEEREADLLHQQNQDQERALKSALTHPTVLKFLRSFMTAQSTDSTLDFYLDVVEMRGLNRERYHKG